MWIGDYMAREGIDAAELAARAREYGRMQREKPIGQVSRLLIETLDRRVGHGFTHPKFADAIAAVCGATAKQRDMIVDKKHRGTWRMTDAAKARAEEAARRAAKRIHPWRTLPAVQMAAKSSGNNGRAVVKINRYGDVMERYGTVLEAAVYNHRCDEHVRAHCRGKLKYQWGAGYSFRYADEWDHMTPEEKRRSVRGEYGAAVE